MRRIGIVGLEQVLKVVEYLAQVAAFPAAEIVEARSTYWSGHGSRT